MKTKHLSFFFVLKKVLSVIIFPIYIMEVRRNKRRKKEESRRLAIRRNKIFRY
mgnify:FL=1